MARPVQRGRRERRCWRRWFARHRRATVVAAVVAALLAAAFAADVAWRRGDESSSPLQPSLPASSTAAPTTVAPPPDELPAALQDFFPIGVDLQPADTFEQWKALGINTVIRSPTDDVNAWADAASAAGLHQIRVPREPETADIGDQLLLAWMHRDEPDNVDAQIPPRDLVADYDRWKGIDPQRLVLINVMGGMDQYDVESGASGPEWYRSYFESADLISADRYPLNRGRPLTEVGDVIDQLQGLAPSKPVFAYIEASDYDTTNGDHPPTAAQVRALVWHAIIRGARGIWYFPERVRPSFRASAVPDEVLAAMPALHQQITELQHVLQGPINPDGVTIDVDLPLEVAWRRDGADLYIFVLNTEDRALTDQPIRISGGTPASLASEDGRSLTITDGTLVDDFEPYEVHVYRTQ